MTVQRELLSLLHDAKLGAERHLVHSSFSPRKLASFAYVAEQYGYRYEGISTAPGSLYQIYSLRRLPDADERAARTAELHPDAHLEGRLPGMRAGRNRLVPLPEARREVDLIQARMRLDATEPSYRSPRVRTGLVGALVVFLVFAVAGALYADSPGAFLRGFLIFNVGFAVIILGAYALGRAVARRWRTQAERLLAREGIEWPPDRGSGTLP